MKVNERERHMVRERVDAKTLEYFVNRIYKTFKCFKWIKKFPKIERENI